MRPRNRPNSQLPSDRETLIYCAGCDWDDIPGTDKHLAARLTKYFDVLWVDPPESAWTLLQRRHTAARRVTHFASVQPSLMRLHNVTLPGGSRPMIRAAVQRMHRARIRRTVERHGLKVSAVVVANPQQGFPNIGVTRVLYVTDDWIAGSRLMGLRVEVITKQLKLNLASANIVCAVSTELLDDLSSLTRDPIRTFVLPNGCDPTAFDTTAPRPSDVPAGPYALLIGQLNERLDLSVLRALTESGLPLVVIGPRREREIETTQALDKALSSRGVSWLGERSADQLPAYLSAATVGLTPYANSKFNRASFPLKTLEYLAAGLPVVSTDLPAARQISTPHIKIAQSAMDFVAQTVACLRLPGGSQLAEERRTVARAHSWEARAQVLHSAISLSSS